MAAADDKLPVSCSPLLGTSPLDKIRTTGSGAAANLKASSEETEGTILKGA